MYDMRYWEDGFIYELHESVDEAIRTIDEKTMYGGISYMEINSRHKKWNWALIIIRKYGGYREKAILHGGNVTMRLLEDDVVEVLGNEGSCLVHIPEYNEQACCICG